MQKIIFYIGGGILCIIIAIGFLMYSGSREVQEDTKDQEQLNIAATIFPLYDIVRIVAGDTANVNLLLPPGASPHFFEFTPRQVSEFGNVDVAFAIGHGVDDWTHDAFNANDIEIITVDKGISLRENTKNKKHAIDPHYWLSLDNGAIITQTVADTLAQKDPDNAIIYQQNAKELITQITQADSELQNSVEQLSCKDLIVLHGAWHYFAQHFKFNIVGVFMPETGETPSPQYFAQLNTAVEAQCGDTIFSEPQLSTQAINSFVQNNNLDIATLDPIGGVSGRETYIDLIVYNVNTIINALIDNE